MFTFHESLCPFFCEKSSDFPFESLWKSYFVPQTNTSHLINYRINQKREQIVKIYNGAGSRRGQKFLGYKKIRIENHQSQSISMTFWTARETNT